MYDSTQKQLHSIFERPFLSSKFFKNRHKVYAFSTSVEFDVNTFCFSLPLDEKDDI